MSFFLIFHWCLASESMSMVPKLRGSVLAERPVRTWKTAWLRAITGGMDRSPSLTRALAETLYGDGLFDAVPDTVYFLKDRDGRYRAVNQTLVERTGRKSKSELLGRTPEEIFPGDLGRRIAEQDRAIMDSGRMLAAELELHLYADGSEGWCLTWKSPIADAAGVVAGLFGMSRDVKLGNDASDEGRALSDALSFARHHLDQALRISDLASCAGPAGLLS